MNTTENRKSNREESLIPLPPTPAAVSEHVSKSMKANKASVTKPKLTLRKALRGIGLKGYRLNWPKAPRKARYQLPWETISHLRTWMLLAPLSEVQTVTTEVKSGFLAHQIRAERRKGQIERTPPGTGWVEGLDLLGV